MDANVKDTDVIEISKQVLETMIADSVEKSVSDKVKNEVEKASIDLLKSQSPIIRVGDDRSEKIAFGSLLENMGKVGLNTSSQNTLMLTIEKGNIVKTPHAELIEKTMTAGDLGSGGAFQGTTYSNEVVRLLNGTAVVRQSGARIEPMPNGNLSIPKETSDVSAAWVGETEKVNASQMGTGMINLSAKKLATVVSVSNTLLRTASYNIAELLQSKMISKAAEEEDKAFLTAAGSAATPKGILGWVDNANKFNSAGDTVANIRKDIAKAKGLIASANIPVSAPALFINPRDYAALEIASDANSTPAFALQLQAGNFGGYRIFQSTNVPIYTGTDAYVILADMGHARIGQTTNVQVEFLPNATFIDGSGNIQSGVSTDTSVFRLIHEVDFALVYSKAAAIVQQVSWGA